MYKVKFSEHAMKTDGTAVLILNLGARWCMVSSTHWRLYHSGKSPWYSMNRRGDGGVRADLRALEKSLSPLLGIERRFLGFSARSPVASQNSIRIISPILATCPTRLQLPWFV